MAIPYATTTITIKGSTTNDPFMPETETVIATGVRAHIDHRSGTEISNERTEQQYLITCDIIAQDIQPTAVILDEKTNVEYEAVYIHQYNMAGTIAGFLSHTEIGAMKVIGSTAR